MKNNAPDIDEAAGESPVKLGEVLEFMRLLWAVDHGLQMVSKRMRTELGLTGPQRLVVRIVGRRPGISAGEVARVLHVHPSTLTGVLRRLQAAGTLERAEDPTDARRALLKLTSKGRQIDEIRTGTVESVVRRVLGRIEDKDVQAASRVLRAMADELAAPQKPAREERKRR